MSMAFPSLPVSTCWRSLGIAALSSGPTGSIGVAGSPGKGGNFVETMLKKASEGAPIRVVDDQVLTPTFTGHLAEAVSQLIRTEAYGLYHVSEEGQCSWYEFARKIFELEKLPVDLKPVNSAEFP